MADPATPPPSERDATLAHVQAGQLGRGRAAAMLEGRAGEMRRMTDDADRLRAAHTPDVRAGGVGTRGVFARYGRAPIGPKLDARERPR